MCLFTVHDTENLTFSADDGAENPHISARTISGFRAKQLASSIPIMIFRTIFAACFSTLKRCCVENSRPPARKFRGTRAQNPRRTARRNHGIPRKKLSFPCHVLYVAGVFNDEVGCY